MGRSSRSGGSEPPAMEMLWRTCQLLRYAEDSHHHHCFICGGVAALFRCRSAGSTAGCRGGLGLAPSLLLVSFPGTSKRRPLFAAAQRTPLMARGGEGGLQPALQGSRAGAPDTMRRAEIARRGRRGGGAGSAGRAPTRRAATSVSSTASRGAEGGSSEEEVNRSTTRPRSATGAGPHVQMRTQSECAAWARARASRVARAARRLPGA